ncbi:MAG: MFS transporter [Novosphingobium sp.]|nr:MFS transporter [Novosphingobium sp.]
MRGIYFGWYVVAAAIVIYTLVVGTTFASFGLYILPVSEEFSLSRADVNTGLIALNLGNALLAPVVGRLLDRASARKVMISCSLMIGISMVIISQTSSLMLDIALIAVPVAAGLLGAGTISGSVLLARWFKVHRGRAMALASLGFSLGGVIVAPLIGQLIEAQGWRFAVLVMGCGSGLILTLIGLFMRDRPGQHDIEPGAAAAEPEPVEAEPEASDEALASAPAAPGALAILRMPLFWQLSLGIGISSAISQGLTVSLVPIALGAGLTTMEGSILISGTGIAGIVAMLVLAAWGDKVDRTVLLATIIIVVMIPCALLLVAKSYVALMLTALVLGFTTAILAPTYIALMADRFGLAAFGTVRGLLVPVMSVTGAVSVRFIGEVYDRTNSYEFGLWVYLALSLLAAALIMMSRPRKAAAA